MINKFQQGGKQDEAIMQFVQGIAQVLQADPNDVIQMAQQNPNALKDAVQVFQQTQDIQKAAQAFQQSLQKKTQAAKHGAKLNYIKSLKNKCPEGEELYYFKRGGSVGCGCRKMEDGGKPKTTLNKGTAVNKFKNRKVQTDFSKDEEEYFKGYHPANNGDSYKPSERGKKPKNNYKKSEEDYFKGVADYNVGEERTKVQKKCGGSKMKLIKKGDKVCPKCGKIHSAKTGCTVAKFKYAVV